MPCGCIVGECPVCKEFIYDDEYCYVDDTMLHIRCKTEYLAKILKCETGQVKIMQKQNKIRQHIKDLEEEMENEFSYFKDTLKMLKNELDELENSNG